MLSPFSGAPDAIETVEHTAYGRGECGRAADMASPSPPGLPSIGRRSKARVLCTWKGCDYQEPDVDEMR